MEPKGSPTSGRQVSEGIWRGKRVRFLAGQVIVKLKPLEEGQDARRVSERIAQAFSARVKGYPDDSGRMLLVFDRRRDVLEVARQLSDRPDVEYAEPDVADQIQQLKPNDARYTDQWAHCKIGSEHAWALHTGDPGVLIGVIDTGISMTSGALDHPDLSTQGRFILGKDYVDGGVPRDLHGHGTHVTGIVAAASNGQGVAGMNWTSPVYICRTADPGGTSGSNDFYNAVKEIVDYAVAGKFRAVINYSSGGDDNEAKREACRYARDREVLISAAAGNDKGGPLLFPAAYTEIFDNVIAVGATDEDDSVSGLSSTGPELTVVAPGEGILSTTPTYKAANPYLDLNYDYINGTSMAAPLVAGLIALMWSRHPGATYLTIRDCLISTAVKLGPGTFDNAWGHGRISAEAAMGCVDTLVRRGPVRT